MNVPFFAPLIGKFTSYALNKLADELTRSRRPDFPSVCTGTFARTMGLPCGHELKRWNSENSPLQPAQIHRHWFYLPLSADRNYTPVRGTLLLNPLQINSDQTDDVSSRSSHSEQEPAPVERDTEFLAPSANSSNALAPWSDGLHGVPAPIPPAQVPLLEPLELEPQSQRLRSTRQDSSQFVTVGMRVRRRRAREAAARE